jgi:cell wall-associated NlpC family hydrolase
MEWHTRYMAVPFADKGRDMSGMDCWGLVRDVYAKQLKINLPSYEWVYHDTVADCKDISETVVQQSSEHWTSIQLNDAQEYDVIIMRMRGLPMHVGVVTRRGYMLHCVDGVGVSHECYQSARWRNRVVGIVRYAAA